MKLTIIRLQQFSPQDRQDLSKVWPEKEIAALEARLDDQHRLYAARFNDRLLGALMLEISGTQGRIFALQVREVTRRRGVGQYLLSETLAQNPSISHWWIAQDGSEQPAVIAAFMQAAGFRTQTDGWVNQGGENAAPGL
ncbi:aspartate 1-decarboxylase autocleavage activator PanM [Erwiniaceae bacterium BAC15a-03b]|uniref:PanD regulatory factor n=1 Tax=Winslowiella arboricola TaxID=2978220 RepID=A0A9J6PPC6_9GAMM|nr:aspartate 1-decarboxylase autocleavage activator PanM [Winslowiella arboricola]MCU5771234.1 aspartate 1-decarboxylase autocleavage activator PanM [Winslowiella arboricola]MCU5777541.1 aspartate 1-decarboxylase autocleavage activator PanM [Winslowiella arboricola]